MALVLWLLYFLFLIVAFTTDSLHTRQYYEKHMGGSVAVPLAGLGAFLLVTALQIPWGKIGFEFGSFKLTGAAGPLLFWIISYLAIIFGIWLIPS